MRTRVKICGITREEDALAAAHAGADAIGLVFWRASPRAIDPLRAREIAGAVPPFVAKVGLFVDPSAEDVNAVLSLVPLDLLQFHGSESPATCRVFDRPYLKAIPMRDELDLLESVSGYSDAAGLLFDTFRRDDMPGGTGHTFDWSRLTPDARRKLRAPLILSGGLDPQNVGAAIRAVQPWAVDVSSGVEELDSEGAPRKGMKDAARIAAFMEGVRRADA